MKTKRLAQLAVLTAAALAMFVIELQIPLPLPTGIKLGLSNIVTVCVLFLFGRREALAVLLVRVLLGAVVAGRLGALPYSLAGGLLSLLVLLPLKPLFSEKQLWIASVIGGLMHNLGQLGAAIAITRTPALAAYLPVLLLGGMAAGLFTGLCAQLVYSRLRGTEWTKRDDEADEKTPQK